MYNTTSPDTRTFLPGAYPAKVFATNDPANQGRIRVIIPQIYGNLPLQFWAPPTGAGATAPAVGSVVWVLFQGGDPSYPVWISGTGGGGSGYAQLATSQQTTVPLDGTVYSVNASNSTLNSGAAPSWMDSTGHILQPGIYLSSLDIFRSVAPATHGLTLFRSGPFGNMQDLIPVDTTVYSTGVEATITCLDMGSLAVTDLPFMSRWEVQGYPADSVGTVGVDINTWRLA